MFYYSTRDIAKAHPKTSAEAIKQGISEDGGLFCPETIPTFEKGELEALCAKTYPERAADILSKYLTDYTREELLEAAREAYAPSRFPGGAAPISMLGKTHRVLELWHGPTCAFKDMALQIMPRLLSRALTKTGETKEALILVATSGDTGKAALEGYKDVDRVKIMVFYPEDGVSAMQKLQMTSQSGENVCVCAIRGNFDDAQNGVKKIFSDPDAAERFASHGTFLSSANSINWGRLAPQIVYYVSAYCDLLKNGDIRPGEPVDVTVPTGNFGNIFAAYLAKRMGVPFGRLLCASNRNNILTDFLTTGVYDRNRPFYTTISPSMDILISSNLERLLYFTAGPERCTGYMKALSQTGRYEVEKDVLDLIRAHFDADFCSEENTRATIRSVFEEYGYLIDPHTACAFYASRRRAEAHGSDAAGKILTVSTASPYKFAADVLASLGKTPAGEGLFAAADALEKETGTDAPAPLAALRSAKVRFDGAVGRTAEEMLAAASSFVGI